jgi:hypothetical protein
VKVWVVVFCATVVVWVDGEGHLKPKMPLISAEEPLPPREGMISEEECAKAIKSMQNGKSPGTDGLPVEFYKIFWKNIKKLVMNSFSYSYENENMSISQKQSIIALLSPKKIMI